MIDGDEVQQLILRRNHAWHLDVHFLSFTTRNEVRTFARSAAKAITTTHTDRALREEAEERGEEVRGQPGVYVGLSGEGVRLASVPTRVFDALPSTFTRGMAHAAPRLGDRGEAAPERWEAPFEPGSPPVHAVVVVADGGDTSAIDQHLVGARPQTSLLATWTADHRDGHEAFGFRDGISEPVLEGSGLPCKAGDGVWDAEQRRWRRVRTGEALLGHRDEGGALAGHPDAAHLERDGSYLVVRKLEQDVAGFDAACDAWSAALKRAGKEVSSDEVAAGLVGRHKDGTPLGLDRTEGPPTNDFLYDDERASSVAIPPSAHIRRANPRDAIASANAIVRRHLLFRRSLPYDDDPDLPARHPDKHEGLLFLAVCADLQRQFEFVQSEWLQDGNRFGLGEERDALVGDRPRRGTGDEEPSDEDADGEDDAVPDVEKVSLAVGDERVRRPFSSFVTMRGGEYFLLASRSSLRLLGDLRDD